FAGDSLITAVTGLLRTIDDTLNAGQRQITGAIGKLGKKSPPAASGPFGELASVLENIVNIGLNVQAGPNHQPRDTKYPFTSALSDSPDQAHSPVDGQSLVRAIEIDLLDTSGLPSPPSNFAAAAPGSTGSGGPVAVLAL